ncbi:SPFH domain-containing protein [Aerococcus sp. CDC-944-U94]|uniref:SPFH domain-containing protein n=1 Tax=Aerococcus urinae (strain CCUG 59500 / ACS-120-V-Col10a) TaxID=2976812 RepID=UPI00227B5D00|nr:SPFH domain-containing protein [Aerococcus sp. Group 1]MCY3054875.1 SPFH domain-containing protein [Aerococcus sp. Group 1]MCY3056605.1 SPFH domain-containing protein [Aerococcus sp. Group 1]
MTETVLTGKKNGMAVLIAYVIGFILAVILLVADLYPLINALAIAYLALAWLILFGLKVLSPQESLVLTLFGRYIGTLKGEGFYFVNPFSQAINPAAGTYLGQSGDVRKTEKQSADDKNAVQFSIGPSKKISLKAMTLNNSKQKINDYLGNPVEIDTTGDGEPDDGSLRGSSEIVALRIKEEIQSRVDFAGLEIVEARITHLSYAPEIAAAMLQRQQASALIDARAMIVDGAVGMVEMALDKLEAKQVVDLDEERKAAMVSNLLVVLCGNSEVSPIVNSGSLY